MTPTEPTIRRFLRAAPVKWPAMIDKLHPLTQADIGRTLDSDIERQTFLAAYLSARAYGQDSTGASKIARRKVVKVRRALGYSYPKQGAFANLSI